MARPNYTLRELEALRATISTGTTTAAARRLGISQPAVSRALSQLESRMGRNLFSRQGARLEPTADAIAFNTRLDGLFQALIDLERPAEDPELETLRVAAPPTLAHRFVVERIATFAGLHPTGLIKLEICTSEEVVVGLLDARFDLGLTGASQTRAGLKLVPFQRSRTVFVARRDHPLASRDVVAVAGLDERDYVAVTLRHGMRRWFDHAFDEAGVRPRVVAEVGTSVAAVELARRGLGFTLINPFPLLNGQNDLVVLPLDLVHEQDTSFALASDRPVSNVARAFMRHVRFSLGRLAFSESQ